jgi:hypothetical protein
MSIYMDRQYVEGATAHAVAIAHSADLAVQDEYRGQVLDLLVDDVRSTAFCLVDSPDREPSGKPTRSGTAWSPHEIIEVDPAVVEAFLGRVRSARLADRRPTMAAWTVAGGRASRGTPSRSPMAWPPGCRSTRCPRRWPIVARVVWAVDGEEHIDTVALGWTGQAV